MKKVDEKWMKKWMETWMKKVDKNVDKNVDFFFLGTNLVKHDIYGMY